jgi:hypothetical protein
MHVSKTSYAARRQSTHARQDLRYRWCRVLGKSFVLYTPDIAPGKDAQKIRSFRFQLHDEIGALQCDVMI